MNPSLSAPPAPRPPSIRQALLATFGAVEPTLFVHPRQYSDAFLIWLNFPQEQRWLKLPVPQRRSFLREVRELEAVFPTSAFLRNGGSLIRFQQTCLPGATAHLQEAFRQEFQDLRQGITRLDNGLLQTNQAYQAALSPNQQLRSLLDSDASDFGYQP